MNMNGNYSVIAMPALTGALRAESLLQKEGIPVRVVKLPAGSTAKGCAYGVEVSELYLGTALRRIDAAHIAKGEVLKN